MKKIALFLLLTLMGCNEKVLYQGDSGKTLTLAVGQEFSIKLPENPSTGYRWEIQTNPQSQMVVANVSDQYAPSKSNLIGAGGERTFRYQATNNGQVELYGFHKRSWESGDLKPSFKFVIIVR
ncbi:MAG: protease inhibitor I42 family protein [Alphaproteobacteria bacterium]|nr:protease inhibitor I42 family protein [Alphaproteobacteria bacterium]